jgi:hypothetical protein
MRLTATELRELHQRSTTSPDRASCPAPDKLAALARGDLAARERGRVVEHLAVCSSCALEARLALEVEPWSDELILRFEEGLPDVGDLGGERGARRTATRSRRSRGMVPQLALAAAILAMLAAGVWLVGTGRAPGPPPGDEVLRGEDEAVVPRSGSALDTPPERLAWPPQPGATGYRVVLFDARAERLWESPRLVDPDLALPPEARAHLQSDGNYLWLVEVAGAAPRRELGPYRFRVAR